MGNIEVKDGDVEEIKRDYQVYADVDEFTLDDGIVAVRLYGDADEMKRFQDEVELTDTGGRPLRLELDDSTEIGGYPTYLVLPKDAE